MLQKNLIPLLVTFLLGSLSAWLILLPPKPAGVDAPDAEFSAERAMRVVEAIAQSPHPIGSRENVRVRDWLAAELEGIGWEVDVESGLIFQGDYTLSYPQNVYARLPGADSQGTILLTGHYDSVPFGPGAADDCSSIAALVETARALSAGPRLRNDVVLSLSDGEEGGLRGAKALLAHAPWAEDIKVVANFETRGVRGPSLMFQSNADAAMLKDFLETVPYPVASSAMQELAALMPTRTEFYVYRESGYRGFDFAFIRGLEYYHTMKDSPENLDRGSLQHHGSYALGLARYFGNADLSAPAGTEKLAYFNLFGHWIVSYPASWTEPLTWAVALLALCPLVVGLWLRRFELKQAALAVGLLLVPVPIVVVINAITPIIGLSRFGPYAVYNQPWYIVGYLALTLAFLLPYLGWVLRKAGLLALVSVACLMLCPLLVGLFKVFPAGTFLLLWPLFGLAVASLGVVCLKSGERARGWHVLAALGALPAVLLFPPLIGMSFDAFTLVLGPVFMLLVLLFAILILPALSELLRNQSPWVRRSLFAVALLANAVAVFDNRFTPQRPKMYDLQYSYDQVANQAWWMTTEDTHGDWLGGFFPEHVAWNLKDILPGDHIAMVRSPAPLPRMDAGTIHVEKVEEHDGRRTYTIKVKPGPATNGFVLFTTEGNKPIEARVAGRPFGTPHKPGASWLMRYQGRCDDGLTIQLDYPMSDRESSPVVDLTKYMQGFPSGPDMALADRPDWLIPMTNTMPTCDFSWGAIKSLSLYRMIRFQHGNWSNGSFIHSSYTLDRTPK